MEGQGAVEGNAALGHLFDPAAPAGEVLGVVIVPVVKLLQGHAAVLHAGKGAFYVGGHAGDSRAAVRLAHTASKPDGIGSNNAGGTPVGR